MTSSHITKATTKSYLRLPRSRLSPPRRLRLLRLCLPRRAGGGQGNEGISTSSSTLTSVDAEFSGSLNPLDDSGKVEKLELVCPCSAPAVPGADASCFPVVERTGAPTAPPADVVPSSIFSPVLLSRALSTRATFKDVEEPVVLLARENSATEVNVSSGKAKAAVAATPDAAASPGILRPGGGG